MWRDRKNQDRIDSQHIPPELKEFLFAHNEERRFIRNISNIRCCLGPYNASFFAHDGSAYRWMSLPTGLLTALQARVVNGEWTDRPRLICLGANNNFVLITENNSAIWSLDNYQNLLHEIQNLSQKKTKTADIWDIALHGYRYNCFVLVSRDGRATHNGHPPHMLPGIEAITITIPQDIRSDTSLFLTRKQSGLRETLPRQTSNLQKRAQLRREWTEHSQQFTAQTKGVKLSLSISVSAAGLMKVFR